jgi:hypothetical protein
MSIYLIFYRTWHFSELISSTKWGAAVIYVGGLLLNFGLHNTQSCSGVGLASPGCSMLGLASKPQTQMTWKANVFALAEEV